MEFKKFKTAVAEQFKRMVETGQLFRTNVSKDELWELYLNSFPPGTNEVFRERREYDCTCCRQFFRTVGDVVSVAEGRVVSVWDIVVDEPAFQQVADAVAEFVKSQPIGDVFLHYEKTAGTDRTLVDGIAGIKSWDHFFVNLPKEYVLAKNMIGTKLNDLRGDHDVLKRGLEEITLEALDTVLDLISQNALYKGEENKFSVTAFQQLKKKYSKFDERKRDAFVWSIIAETPGSVTRLRNTSIGTLLIDLSDDEELEVAVKKFESVVAPANYKRPTALVSKKMIEDAKAKITELGLGSALERRYATIEDITVNNILFANRKAKRKITAEAFEDVMDGMAAKVPTKALDKVEDVPIDKFVHDILPRIDSMEVLVENKHVGNLVSLVTAVDPTAPQLFKWDNPFSWSYNGDVADSIKERVKKAGGNVDGDLCCRLAWEYRDDLDFYMYEPTGYQIYFGTRHVPSTSGGRLDVDANGGSGMMDHPVENIFYADKKMMVPGLYKLKVHNYNRRDPDASGFEVEIEFGGTKHHIEYANKLRQGELVDVATIKYDPKTGFEIVKSLPSSQTSKNLWGIATQTYVPVSVLMLSPNYWDEQGVGNKHWFFMLEGCQNEGAARGFYNEFLTQELTAHRKVLEMVGSKMKTEQSDRQLSGLGFSSTQRNSVTCRVKGSFSRVINLVF